MLVDKLAPLTAGRGIKFAVAVMAVMPFW